MVQLLVDNWPIVLIGVVMLLAYVLGKVAFVDRRLPYEKRKSLLTQSEQAFFNVLRNAVDGEWSIQAMVRLADLIRVKPDTPKYQAWQNRIQAKHIDFLLCDPATLEVKLALELDDKSHQRPDRVERDQFVEQALADAGVPLMRLNVQEEYNVEAIRDSIDDVIDA